MDVRLSLAIVNFTIAKLSLTSMILNSIPSD